MRRLLLTLMLAALPAVSHAATTSTVKVLLKNSGVGSFSSLHSVKVLANCDYNSYDKTAYAPTYGSVTLGNTFYAQFSGLYVYSGYQGTYSFDLSFWDTDGVTQKKIVVGAGTRFPGSGTYWVSKLGVTTTQPSASYAFDVSNAAPPAATGLTCYPEPPNTATDMYLYWSASPRPGDYDKVELQRASVGSSYWTTVRSTLTWGSQSYTNTGLQPGTSYRYRVATFDYYGAVSYSSETTCRTTDADHDGDGYIASVDCNDLDASIHPGAFDFPNDGIDQDCDGQDTIDLDQDGDGIGDDVDNCPLVANVDQADLDADGLGDACDPDDDADGIVDTADNCPRAANAGQEDFESDGIGDVCDADDDADGVVDTADNCLWLANAGQADLDHDQIGDACDTDDDGDGIADEIDNCAQLPNADQADVDADGLGDLCDPDSDGDGIDNGVDNCARQPNPGQEDLDADGVGDACDTDDDGDGVPDGTDLCPAIADPDQADADHDGIGDACDPLTDSDGDLIADSADNCVQVPNADQSDMDNDGIGDACDPDDDGDGVGDDTDRCPFEKAGAVDLLGDGCLDTACDLEQYLSSLPATELDQQFGNSLTAKARNACGSLQSGNLNASANKLEALLNEVRAQSGKHVSENAAHTLQLAIEAMLAR